MNSVQKARVGKWGMDISRKVRQSRARGRYGEQRLAKKVNGVVVDKNKFCKLPDGRFIQIDITHPPDVLNATFAFESKWLKSAPESLKKVMAQAVSNAPFGFVPVGVIGDRGCREVFYIMNEQDFLALHVGENGKTKGRV